MIGLRGSILLMLGALAISARSVSAQDAPSTPAPVELTRPIVIDPPGPAALDDRALQALNGREGVTVVIAASEQWLHAVNSGNSVNGQTVGSGDIVIGPGAFSGFNGIGNFVINSGHNNNLQGAITINIATGAPTP